MSRSSKTKAASPMPLPSTPRDAYLAAANETPSQHPSTPVSTSHQLPLLVLDLNGTLLFRNGARSSASPIRRPYLGSFLAYALGLDHSKATQQQLQAQWNEWDFERMRLLEDDECNSAMPHGSTFWPTVSTATDAEAKGSSHPLEPAASLRATCRTLVWSSAQSHNVYAMVRAILAPSQAQHLLRVWARETLVPERWINDSVASIKDLDIVWHALNVTAGSKSKQQAGEKRVLAEYRFQVDECAQSGRPELNLTPRVGNAQLGLQESRNSKRKQASRAEKAYGPHNTLLLDDSPEKARLQPFNHILLPEFDAARASATQAWRTRQKKNAKDVPTEIDDVLLQLVGVLAHARWERNVSAWIRTGGLGWFGGVEHPGMEGSAEPNNAVTCKVEEEAVDVTPRIHTPIEQRTQYFWVQEGKRALKAAGIACEPGL